MSRILMTAARTFPKTGGVERHVESIRRELESAGHSVAVVEMGIGLHAFTAIPRVIAALWREKYDVIHTHDFAAAIPTWIAMGCSLRRGLFVTVHGYEGFPLRRTYVLAHRIAHLLANKTIAVGAYLDTWYGTKSDLVLHGGVRDTVATAESDPPLVVFIGRLALDTNCMEAAQAMIAVAGLFPDARFRMYGFGPLADTVRQVCSGSPLEFCGEIAQPHTVLESSSVVVANSYLAILEAFSRGKPVVSFFDNPLKRDYLNEIAQASGAIVATGTIEGMRDAIAGLLRHAGRRRELGLRGLAYAKRFRWNNVAADYVNVWTTR